MTIIIIIGALIVLLILFAMSYIKARPDQAIVVTGFRKRKILIGKAGLRIPFLQRTDSLSLRVFQVDIKTEETIPTKEFIDINVDGVANLKVSTKPEMLDRAFEAILNMTERDLILQLQQVLQGNMREIIGTVEIQELVQDRQGVAEKVMNNVVPDMAKLGIEVVNFNIQTFSDNSNIIKNLGIDNTVRISKQAAIAKAISEREIDVVASQTKEEANRARITAETLIIEQNTDLKLKEAQLKKQSETARADADASYEIQKQKRQSEINEATIDAQIKQREREIELQNKEVEIKQRKLEAEINKVADAEKYANEKAAEANLFVKKQESEAKKYELEREAEMQKIKAEAERVVKEKEAEALKIKAFAEAEAIKAKSEAAKIAAEMEAIGIRAKGEAEAEAILKKAEAMQKYGEAATLQLILDSNVLPEIVKAYSQPIAEGFSRIDSITMYGEGNTAKLAEEISRNGDQIFAGLEKATGLDVKSVLAGLVGGKLLANKKEEK